MTKYIKIIPEQCYLAIKRSIENILSQNYAHFTWAKFFDIGLIATNYNKHYWVIN
jgi:hypothetical protein